jgi:hypothetical protein
MTATVDEVLVEDAAVQHFLAMGALSSLVRKSTTPANGPT